MKNELYAVTGGSKGLGLALTELLLAEGSTVLCISRSKPSIENANLIWTGLDLANPASFGSLQEAIAPLQSQNWDSVSLINNAGLVAPVTQTKSLSLEGLSKNINVNLISPMLLTSWFLKSFESDARKKIVNISTGAAVSPKAGWAAYSAAKAGLENFSKTLVDEHREDGSVRVINFNPGIIDTDMQGTIRESKVEDFPDLERFKSFKEDSMLRPPKVVAEALIKALRSSTSEVFLNVNEFL